MSFSTNQQSMDKVFKSVNYAAGNASKPCARCKARGKKDKVITEFSTRVQRGKIYLDSYCRECKAEMYAAKKDARKPQPLQVN